VTRRWPAITLSTCHFFHCRSTPTNRALLLRDTGFDTQPGSYHASAILIVFPSHSWHKLYIVLQNRLWLF